MSAAQTALWGVLVFAVVAAIDLLVTRQLAPAAGLTDDAVIFCLGLIAASLAGTVALLKILRRHDPPNYLGLTFPPLKIFGLWTLSAGVKIALLELAAWLFTRPSVPPAWQETFADATAKPLLVVALIIVGPLFEEMFFRGFLHRGLAATRLRWIGAIAITSVLFSLAHFPADLWSFAHGILVGTLLGGARHHSGSIAPSIAIHAILNGKVLVQLALA